MVIKIYKYGICRTTACDIFFRRRKKRVSTITSYILDQIKKYPENKFCKQESAFPHYLSENESDINILSKIGRY